LVARGATALSVAEGLAPRIGEILTANLDEAVFDLTR
jgi:hypothetical protein